MRTTQKCLLRHGSIFAFTELSHSNGSYAIVVCIFVDAGMYLPSRCLEMGLHVTGFIFVAEKLYYIMRCFKK
jgi:hypothetical protein